ncbi:MAG: hypothetical protein ABFS02_02665 [Pseudomonadota bacterium]
MELARRSKAFVQGRLREAEAIRDDIDALCEKLRTQTGSVRRVIDEHLWRVPEFAETAPVSLKNTQAPAEQLSRRMAAVIDGYDTQLTDLTLR